MHLNNPENDFRSGDTDNNLLRKVLDRLTFVIEAIETNTPNVIIDPGSVTIGGVEINDSVTTDRARVLPSAPAGGENALIVRNIPSGTQTVSGTVSVSNLPVTQPVSGSVAVTNFPVTQPVSGTVAVSNFPDEVEEPFFDAARSGSIAGNAARAFHVIGRRAGFNSITVLQDVAEFLGATTDAMPELTGAESLQIVSSSASDTLAGTGAQKVSVTYLDGSNNIVTSPDISLNGVTPVAAGFTAKFIYWMEVTQVGTNTVAVGTVILRIVGPGATQEQITAGGNRSLSCRFMVPTGYTGYISGWHVTSIGGATQDARLRATVRSGDRSLGTAYIFQDNTFSSSSVPSEALVPYLICPALSKIKVSTNTSGAAGTNRIDSDFTILIIAD